MILGLLYLHGFYSYWILCKQIETYFTYDLNNVENNINDLKFLHSIQMLAKEMMTQYVSSKTQIYLINSCSFSSLSYYIPNKIDWFLLLSSCVESCYLKQIFPLSAPHPAPSDPRWTTKHFLYTFPFAVARFMSWELGQWADFFPHTISEHDQANG